MLAEYSRKGISHGIWDYHHDVTMVNVWVTIPRVGRTFQVGELVPFIQLEADFTSRLQYMSAAKKHIIFRYF
jgi:hypothetical protein